VTEPPSGTALPRIRVPPPGPRSRALAVDLARWESPNVTYLADDFPVFWESARGANVVDADGNLFLDLTAAFAVAGPGHAHPRIVAAVAAQAGRLLHGMGDVHPPTIKVDLLRALAATAPGALTRSILASSGAEAVEAALKTVAIATGRPRVIAFHGGYHGLTYRALAVSGREDFRAPFASQLGGSAVFLPYPYPLRSPFGRDPEEVSAATLRYLEHLLDAPGSAHEGIGAILVEPIQGRGGDLVPPPGFLPGLRRIADERGLLLVLDEVYTGFGRTGRWFACEHEGVEPDLMVVGKGLTGGLPFAACIGTDRVMERWPSSRGEAIHTSTFLGHPLGCAAALAAMDVLREERLVERSAELGARMLARLAAVTADHPRVAEVRGRGLMIGVELVRDRRTLEPAPGLAGRVVLEALRRGLLVLGGGIHGNVISLSPPFVLTDAQADHALDVLEEILGALVDAPDA
jgi:4-aminobutyrate aminotransferase / (S)-3-amino-2-methylpropionate transaminase / 5-aminovalerate transaminase